jgi:general stress protein YciG
MMELRSTVADLQGQVSALAEAVSLIWAKLDLGPGGEVSRGSVSSILDRSIVLGQSGKDDPMAERFAEACIDIGAVDGSFRLSESEMSWRFSERGSQDHELSRISDTLTRISEDGMPSLSLEHSSELQSIREEEGGESDSAADRLEVSRDVKKKTERNSGSHPHFKRVRSEAAEAGR